MVIPMRDPRLDTLVIRGLSIVAGLGVVYLLVAVSLDVVTSAPLTLWLLHAFTACMVAVIFGAIRVIRHRALPVPPTNVRAVLDDGTVIPCDCVYKGVRSGQHLWATVNPIPLSRLVRIDADTRPAHTTLAVGVGLDKDTP